MAAGILMVAPSATRGSSRQNVRLSTALRPSNIHSQRFGELSFIIALGAKSTAAQLMYVSAQGCRTTCVGTMSQAAAAQQERRSFRGEPQRRVRAKTPPPPRARQQLLPEPLALAEEAPPDRRREFYLVTFPHTRQETASTGETLVAPGSFTKQQVLERFLHSCAHPIYLNAMSASEQPVVPIKYCGDWRERHLDDEPHDHSGVAGLRAFSYLPVKRALLVQHGLASHWSCSHEGHWSIMRYLAKPSPKKPFAALDHAPVLWPSQGLYKHPDPEDMCREPITAAAIRAKRIKVEDKALEEGKREPRVSDMDVWAVVVRQGFRNTDDSRNAHIELAAYAKRHCGDVMVHYLFKNRSRLPQLIDDIWQWEEIDDVVQDVRRTRAEAMAAAAASPCVCNGDWLSFIVSGPILNKINIAELCYDINKALMEGRGLQGGECKSAFLKALYSVFRGPGAVFGNPPERANFTLVDLPAAKVIFLDEWRFDEGKLSFSLQDLLFDGSAVPVGRAQNDQSSRGHTVYKGTAPVFVTGKLSDITWLENASQIDPGTNKPWSTEAAMLYRRLKVHRFEHRVPKPNETLPYCAHCFSCFVQAQASVWAAHLAASG